MKCLVIKLDPSGKCREVGNQREKQTTCCTGTPNAGLDPVTPGSQPEPKMNLLVPSNINPEEGRTLFCSDTDTGAGRAQTHGFVKTELSPFSYRLVLIQYQQFNKRVRSKLLTLASHRSFPWDASRSCILCTVE
uniref:Uncharacterized protein n=1 Tax=Mustela putorius furo TaxID=9669 RepID=M3YDZ8_MUSPF